jgi:MFS family permease
MSLQPARAVVVPQKPEATWSVLRNPLFRSLWIANVASGVGSAMHDTAAVWTMATLTPSPTLVTLMQTMSSLPLFLFGLPAGALADILDRRKLIITAQTGSLLVAATLAFLAWRGALNPPVLLTATFLLGLGVAFIMPTWQAILVEVVEKKDLSSALTLGGVGVNIARAIGPVVGGMIVGTAGPAPAFVLNALSFVGIIFMLWRWKRPEQQAGAHAERMLGAIIAALRFTRHSPAIKAVLIRNVAFVFFGIAPVALLPLIVRGRQLGASNFGALVGAYGLGGIIVAFFLLPKLRQRLSADRIMLCANSVFAVLTLLLTVVQRPLAMAAVLFAAGGAWLTSMSTLGVAAQSAFPNWVRARSSAIYLIAVQAALAVGALAWGRVTAHTDTSFALRIAAGGLFANLVLVKVFPLNVAMGLDLTPSRHWSEHQLAQVPAPDDGPVLITVDYTVDPNKAEQFLAAISKLRTIRLRDGAFRWSVFQDLNDPAHFREGFQVGSWGEHLRQHDRATAEDQRIEQAVEALHSGAQPPRVSHYLMRDVLKTKSPRAKDPV